jgi:hypothetical protein
LATTFAGSSKEKTPANEKPWTQKRCQDSFLGPAEEESVPSSSFTAHSGTAFRTPEGELTLRGTRVYSSPTTLDTDQSNPKKSPDTNGTAV